MDKEIIRDGRAEGTRVLDGTVQVDRVPMDDRRGDEAEAGRTKALVLEGPVSNFALAMEEHRTPERVAGLAFVEAGVTARYFVKYGCRFASRRGKKAAIPPRTLAPLGDSAPHRDFSSPHRGSPSNVPVPPHALHCPLAPLCRPTRPALATHSARPH
jgi:hypothetical protein